MYAVDLPVDHFALQFEFVFILLVDLWGCDFHLPRRVRLRD